MPALILFILACDLKPQLILLSVFLILQKDMKNFIRVLLYSAVPNLLGFFFFGGDPIATFRGYIRATLEFTSSFTTPWILDSASFDGMIARQFERFGGPGAGAQLLNAHSPLLIIPGLCYLIFTVFAITKLQISKRAKTLLILPLSSLVVPASMAYTLGWASLGLVTLMSSDEDLAINVAKVRTSPRQPASNESIWAQEVISEKGESSWGLTEWLFLIIIVVLITPSFGIWGGGDRYISISRDIYAMIILLSPLTVMADHFSSRRAH